MQGFVPLDTLWQNRQSTAAPAECCVIRDREIDAKQAHDRSHRPLGLAERLVKNQTKRQPGLDCRATE
jgi:hypothetical protein